MLATTQPILIDRNLKQDTKKHLELGILLGKLYPYTYRIGTGTIIYDVQHPMRGLVTIYQHVNPDRFQPPFTLETFGAHGWLYEYNNIRSLLRGLM